MTIKSVCLSLSTNLTRAGEFEGPNVDFTAMVLLLLSSAAISSRISHRCSLAAHTAVSGAN